MTSPVLADSLRVAIARLSRRMRRETPHENLGVHHLSALGAMQQLDEPTLARIAALEHVKPPSMVKTLNHLESLGYIERKGHPSDGRMVVLSISEKGEEKIAEFRVVRNHVLSAALAALTPQERETLRRAIPVLEKLSES